MTQNDWMTWMEAELSRFAHKLLVQGFDPQKIKELGQNHRAFRKRWDALQRRLVSWTEGMQSQPERFVWFEEVQQGLTRFLKYTNTFRGELLNLEPVTLAESA